MVSSGHSKNILGYVLCALQGLRWMLPEGVDISKTNQQGFSEWLAQKYRTDAALQTAWGKEEITLAEAAIPSLPAFSENPPVFFMLPEMQPVVDFLQYSAESVADALVSLAAATAKSSSNDPSFIIGAPYGFSFETFPNGYGHYALELLLESDLNALLSPVSYLDRGLGGVGGVMGPVDSMTIQGKQWIIIDDTRTGVERDPATGEFGRIKGINVDDVYEVQRRNFAQALAYGLGLVWADPQSEGWLHDADQWKHLGNLGAIYAQQIKAKETSIEQDYSVPVMTVVVDETSRFYVQPGGRAEGILLQKGRDAAMRSGVSLRFHLLRDVIEDIAPPTPVYLFLNAFHLTETDRVRLIPGLHASRHAPSGCMRQAILTKKRMPKTSGPQPAWTYGFLRSPSWRVLHTCFQVNLCTQKKNLAMRTVGIRRSMLNLKKIQTSWQIMLMPKRKAALPFSLFQKDGLLFILLNPGLILRCFVRFCSCLSSILYHPAGRRLL